MSLYRKKQQTLPTEAKTLLKTIFDSLVAEKTRGRLLYAKSNPFQRLFGYLRGKIRSSTLRRIVSDTAASKKCVQDVVRSLTETEGPSSARSTGRPTITRTKLDSFQRDGLIRLVHNTYRRGKTATLNSIKKEYLAEFNIRLSKSTVMRELHRCGVFFKNKRNTSDFKYIREKADMVSKRHHFLRKIRQYRIDKKEIIYLDETWVHQGHSLEGHWSHNSGTFLFPKCSQCCQPEKRKGERLIILDAGSSKRGFIDNALLMKHANDKNADYHQNMDSTIFLEWWSSQLLPKTEPGSVIVMDNAPYHNVLAEEKPTSKWSRLSILSFLQKKGCSPPNDTLKYDLLTMAQPYIKKIKFKTDALAEDYGVQVLRLPAKHCELNPIELIWGIEKNDVARNNTNGWATIPQLHNLFLETRKKITKQHWENAERHVIDIESKFWERDGITQDEIAPILITLGDDDDDDDLDDDNDNDDNDDDNDFDISMSIDDHDSPLHCHETEHEESVAEDEVCFICKSPEPPSTSNIKKGKILWIYCDFCEHWFHAQCAKVNETKIESISHFQCDTCKNLLNQYF